ncbi:MAG: zf-TFIIB domain-containing protein [Elusimicrobiota bacterium]
MNCPRCDSDLKDYILVGKIYHKCEDCGGLWFDRGELAQIMQEKKWFMIDSTHKHASARIASSELFCPREGSLLKTVEYGHETDIKVDICPDCEGLWLDAGEIQAIHKAGETWLERIKGIIEEDLTAVELFLIKIGPYLPG